MLHMLGHCSQDNIICKCTKLHDHSSNRKWDILCVAHGRFLDVQGEANPPNISQKFNIFLYLRAHLHNLIKQNTNSSTLRKIDNPLLNSIKYNIWSHILFSSLNEVIKCISLYISIHEHALYSSHDVINRDLCLSRDHNYHHLVHLLSCIEIKELIEYLCFN